MKQSRALGLARCVAAAALLFLHAAWAAPPADFRQESPSVDARHVADWVLHSRDHAGEPFVIVDKVRSRVFVFDRTGELVGATSALVGLAPGDDSVAGIGQRPLKSVLPEERTTPAGRFVASIGRGLKGEEILWVDYEAAVALHAVAAGGSDRRLQRLAGIVPADRRITYGCINVPVKFFHTVVAPLFRGAAGIVYVLPESRPVREVFGSYDLPAAPAQPR
jgi:hypothetical protein